MKSGLSRGSAALALLATLVATVAACSAPSTPTKTTPAPSAAESPVTAKGVIQPAKNTRLSFPMSGTLVKLNVMEGATVKAGDTLAQLDTKDLDFQVRTAQDALDLAKATLDQAQVPASAEEIAAAQAAYDSAVAALARAQRGPTADDLAILQANLEKSKAAVDQAQAAYDRAGGAANPMAGMLPTSLALQAATLDYQIAQANYAKAVKLDPTTVAQAVDAVKQAEAALNLKKKGPRPEDIAVAQARVRQAQTALEQAKAALSKAALLSPFDGNITDLTVHEGDLVQAGTPLATLADLSQLHVETTDLDEFGAAKVKVGQPAKMTVNAFTNKVLSGKVSDMALQSVILATGDTSYVITVALDQQDPELRWGMTVKVEFGGGQQ